MDIRGNVKQAVRKFEAAAGMLGYPVGRDTTSSAKTPHGKLSASDEVEKDRKMCTKIKTGNPSIYKLTLKKQTAGHFHKLVFGKKPLNVINRTIMVIGATGSGKTTLINGMINYILGVKWEDDFRYKLIDEETNNFSEAQHLLEIMDIRGNVKQAVRKFEAAAGMLGYPVGRDTTSSAKTPHGKLSASDEVEKDRKMCTKIKTGNPSIYKLTLKKQTAGHFHKLVFGKKPLNVINRTIMVIGATGSGKTTLINGMINYILGVKWEDDFRYKLIDEETNTSQAHSQTSEVTAYQIYYKEGFKVPFSLTIIDTPGFGDTKGIQQDKLITEKIREFFSSPDGIDSIDAVCFVVQAALARLTQAQKYIFDSILSIFGKDIENNIQLLVTFADGKAPAVLDAINAAGVPCPKSDTGVPVHFKFNNSVLFEPNGCDRENADEDDFDRMFWRMGSTSMGKLFNNLDEMETRSLQLTKEVLAERKQLQVSVEGLQTMIKVGLSKVEEIRETQNALEYHKHCIEKNKDFEYEVQITVQGEIDISETGKRTTNCPKCHFTCHHPCTFEESKYWCRAINILGYCRVCPGKCASSFHLKQTFKWGPVPKKVKRTYEDLKQQYEEAKRKTMNAEEIVKNLEQEFSAVIHQVLDLIKQLSQSLSRLDEIALCSNPLTTLDYIDLLIQSEQREAKPGFKERIQSLHQVREEAVILQKVASGGKLLPGEQEELKQSKLEVVKGIFTDIKGWFTGGKTN
ncbi:UNVERIFIED_CONTAM: hypothetical protein FKN15_064580 [Acipenser sinensis]